MWQRRFVEAGILAVVLFTIEWHLTLYIFALIPIVTVFAIVYRNIARKATRQGMRAMANVNSTIKETVSGIAVAKNFRQEASIYNEFTDANNTSYKVNVRRGLALSVVFPTLNALAGIATGVMVYAGGLSADAGHRHGGRLVPLHPQPRPLPLPDHEHHLFLDFHPERSFSL